jgi:hypothetical protein
VVAGHPPVHRRRPHGGRERERRLAELPLEAQVFLLWVELVILRRAGGAAAGAAVAGGAVAGGAG